MSTRQTASSVVDAVNPWRFLTALDGSSDTDRRLVQETRREEIQIISHMVAASRASILYAFSGNGKSSLVDAGLIPFLNVNRFAVFKMRPRPPWSVNGPTQAFKESLLRYINLPLFRHGDVEILRQAKAGLPMASSLGDQIDNLISRLELQTRISAEQQDSPEAFRQYLQQFVNRPLVEFIARIQARLDDDVTLALICDQFEELFVHFGNTPAMDDFVSQLGAVWADSSLRVRILFSMREDSVGSMIEFRNAIPDIFRDCFKLEPITRSRAGHVLTLPLESIGMPIEQAAVDAILNDLATSYARIQQDRFSDVNLTPSPTDDPFIELPALQVVADKMWATRSQVPAPFTLAHYQSLSGGNGASRPARSSLSPAQAVLDNYLGDLLAGLRDEDDLSPRQWLELRVDCLYLLTDQTRHRRALPESRLIEELRQIRTPLLQLPDATPERVRHAMRPLLSVRLVREDSSREGERQYELAHDFAVRSAVARWRQLDRERTAELAIYEQEKKEKEQKYVALEQTDARLTWLLRVGPWVSGSLLALRSVILGLGAPYWIHAAVTSLLPASFATVLIAGVLRRHTPAVAFGIVGIAGIVLANVASSVGVIEILTALATLTATVLPLYLWSGYMMNSSSPGARAHQTFAALWSEYIALVKLAATFALSVLVGITLEAPGDVTLALAFIGAIAYLFMAAFEVNRRGYETGTGWTGYRVIGGDGHRVTFARALIRQLVLSLWIGAIGIAGLGASFLFTGEPDRRLALLVVLSLTIWSAAAFYFAHRNWARRVYEVVSGTYFQLRTGALEPAPSGALFAALSVRQLRDVCVRYAFSLLCVLGMLFAWESASYSSSPTDACGVSCTFIPGRLPIKPMYLVIPGNSSTITFFGYYCFLLAFLVIALFVLDRLMTSLLARSARLLDACVRLPLPLLATSIALFDWTRASGYSYGFFPGVVVASRIPFRASLVFEEQYGWENMAAEFIYLALTMAVFVVMQELVFKAIAAWRARRRSPLPGAPAAA